MFAGGGAIKGMAANQAMDQAGWRSRMQDLHAHLHDLLTIDKPVISAVDGYAYGAGFSMALAGDFIINRFCEWRDRHDMVD